MTLDVAVRVECEGWRIIADPQGFAERVIGAALRATGFKLPPDAEVSLLLCDDAAIRALNKAWRKKDKATNVLSFPSAPAGPGAGAPMLGDIVIAFETTRGEAADEMKTLPDHAAHLLAHGFLHLIGYDHESEAEAEEMEAMERRILSRLGIDDPYRVAAPRKAAGR